MKKLITAFLIGSTLLFAASAFAQVPQRPGGRQPPPPRQQPPQAQQAAGQAASQAEEKAQAEMATAEQDKIKVVMHKSFIKKMRFEMTPVVGVSLNDPFKTRLPVGAHLVFHIGENFALGLTGLWNFNLKSSDVTIVRKSGAAPDVTELKYNASLDFYFSPVYGKMAFFSDVILNFDLFIVAGVGIMGASIPDESGIDKLKGNLLDASSGITVAGNIGVGGRLFLLKWLAVVVEIRDYIYSVRQTNVSDKGVSDIQNLVVPFIGISFYLPPGFDYED